MDAVKVGMVQAKGKAKVENDDSFFQCQRS